MLLREHQQLPLDWAEARGMLMMVLRRQRVTLRDPDLVAANGAAINAGVRGYSARRAPRVERLMLRLRQMLTVLVLSHGGSFMSE